MGLQAAYAAVRAIRQDLNFIPLAQMAIGESSRNDRTKTGNTENPVNGQTRPAQVGPGRALAQAFC